MLKIESGNQVRVYSKKYVRLIMQRDDCITRYMAAAGSRSYIDDTYRTHDGWEHMR